MTAALASRQAPSFHGLYPFRPARDLPGVVPLLQLAFRDDLDTQDLAWLTELGALGSNSTWMRILLRVIPPGAALFGGFVWYENGRLVGNVSLMRATPESWVIANVATDPEHRRRGIGQRLVTAAVEAARDGAASAVGLQVRDDNKAARVLYERLGFARVGSATTYRGEPDVDEAAPEETAVGAVRPWTPGPSNEARRVLVRAGALDGAWPPGPLRQSVHSRGLAGRLDDLFRGRDRRGWVANLQGEACGMGVVYVERVEGHHAAEFAVVPSHRGDVERALMQAALGAVAVQGGYLNIEVPEAEVGVAAECMRLGFIPVRTLDRMVLALG